MWAGAGWWSRSVSWKVITKLNIHTTYAIYYCLPELAMPKTSPELFCLSIKIKHTTVVGHWLITISNWSTVGSLQQRIAHSKSNPPVYPRKDKVAPLFIPSLVSPVHSTEIFRGWAIGRPLSVNQHAQPQKPFDGALQSQKLLSFTMIFSGFLYSEA